MKYCDQTVRGPLFSIRYPLSLYWALPGKELPMGNAIGKTMGMVESVVLRTMAETVSRLFGSKQLLVQPWSLLLSGFPNHTPNHSETQLEVSFLLPHSTSIAL